jgi:hypothetical protein
MARRPLSSRLSTTLLDSLIGGVLRYLDVRSIFWITAGGDPAEQMRAIIAGAPSTRRFRLAHGRSL